MSAHSPRRSSRLPIRLAAAGLVLSFAAAAVAAIFNMTLEDFHLSGTQIGDVSAESIWTSHSCMYCHGPYYEYRPEPTEPYSAWKSSLMGNAGRDPLFYAQLATANQDVANAGYFCLRCHVPLSMVSGHAYDASGQSLTDYDRDGVSCHFCHSMVDPIYKKGVSPPEDVPILQGLEHVPQFYANAMFVLDPSGARRGPRSDAEPMHEFIQSAFHRTGEFCGTCHDVGNVAVTRQSDGTYRYNAIDKRTPDENPWMQFPLERTYTEWKLSAFANGGVDMGGRFGGQGVTVVSTCQDCHMPRTSDKACYFGPNREDMATHDFAGSAAWVLEIIGLHYEHDPEVDQEALKWGRVKAIEMLRRAASLELEQRGSDLGVRVINETGHKLPTGHIEGRRVFLNVRFFDAQGNLVHEHGRYNRRQARLDERSTRLYEMKVGLSARAARATGLPRGVTTHMALADTIMKDTRIPPRGFSNAAFEQGGAPVVGTAYADGQHWDDAAFPIPVGAVSATVTLYYQVVTRHYIEALRDGNHTDDWGEILHDLWLRTDKAPPIEMVSATISIGAPQ